MFIHSWSAAYGYAVWLVWVAAASPVSCSAVPCCWGLGGVADGDLGRVMCLNNQNNKKALKSIYFYSGYHNNGYHGNHKRYMVIILWLSYIVIHMVIL